jgi:two-component system sensor histidine kinase/response regulator
VPTPEEPLAKASHRPMPGARVLVAEDNPTNQLVAARLLRTIGIDDVAVVASGQEAVQRLAAERFDLVLMDCHMPVMDGYQATRRLRQQGIEVPVIAMTANAMADDRERCLQAGMNDHLAKPVALQTMQEVVYRWLPRVLDAKAALERLEQDEPLYRQVLETALADIPAQMLALRDAVAKGSVDGAHRCVHAMKGTAGTAGAAQLAVLASGLQSRLESQGPAGLPERAVDDLAQAVEAFRKAATAYLEGAAVAV